MNSNIISSNELNNCLNFFDLNINYSLEDLENSRYTRLKENKLNYDQIDNNYKILLNFKLNPLSNIDSKIQNVDFNDYRNTFILDYSNKYFDLPARFIDKDELNDKLDKVKSIANLYYEQIRNSNIDNIALNINLFYKDYIAVVNNFLDSYINTLNNKNDNRVKNTVLRVKNSYLNKTLKYSLNELVHYINEDIKANVIKTLRYQNDIKKSINVKLNKLNYFFKREEVSAVLKDFYENIDKFLNDISIKIQKKIYDFDITSEEEKNNILNIINEELDKEIQKYGDSLEVNIRRSIIESIQSINNEELYKLINQKLNNAYEFEDYQEIVFLIEENKANLQNR